MKLHCTNQSYLLKMIFVSLFCICAISSFVARAESIEEVLFYDKPLYAFKGKTPHISLPVSVEFTIAAAAWSNVTLNIGGVEGTEFTNSSAVLSNKQQNNLGYFNHKLCYLYNTSAGYFYPSVLIDSNNSCPSGQFSGNFMNWATHTTLDIFRYALTGGSRDIDTPDLTILKRARTNNKGDLITKIDGSVDLGLDIEAFYFPLFPMRYNSATGVAPLVNHKFANNCGEKIYFSDDSSALVTRDCSNMEVNPLVTKYNAKVQVCNPLDASLRPDYCIKYPNGKYKPEGVLQQNSQNTRFSLLGYLNISNKLKDIFTSNLVFAENNLLGNGLLNTWATDTRDLMWGGVLRANARFIGKKYYDTNLNFYQNNQQEWDANTGVIFPDINHKYSSDGTMIQNNDFFASYKSEIKGNESVANGTSIINYLNQFGFYDKYRGLDAYTELVGETFRYLANYKKSTSDLNLPSLSSDPVTNRDPLHVYNRINNSLIFNKQEALRLHTDTFPFIKNWDWAANNIDEPVRSVCEKDNLSVISIADTNNWRSEYVSSPTWQSTAIHENNFFTGTNLKDLINIINPSLHNLTNPLSDASQSEWFSGSQNRYISSAIFAGANFNGINYQNNSSINSIKIKSTVIDVGEKSGSDCSLYTGGIYGSHTQNEIDNLVSQGKTCSNWNYKKTYGTPDEIDTAMPVKGYLYPSSPNNIIYNIRRAFKIPVDVSGNISAGVTQNLDWQEDGSREVYRFQNNLRTNASSLDTSISTELKKYQMYLDAADGNKVKSKETADTKDWEGNVKWTLRNHATRNVILGGGFKDGTDGKPTLERNNAVNFTYADINTAGDADAISTLKLGLSEKVTPSLDLTTLVKKRIDYIRGSSDDEQTSTDKKVFRKRDFVLGSTSNSTIEYYPPSDKYGRSMLYLTSNDGMLHGIDADEGRVMFSYIPRETLPKMYDIDMQGYVAKPLIEGAPVARTIIPNNQKKYSKPVTIVASGFGAGAKGVFALDVSNLHHSRTSNVSPSNVIFEFTDKDDPDMGYFIGQPSFVTVWTGKYQDSQGKMQDKLESFVAVTSGYNNINSTTTYDEAGQPKNKMYLFLLKTDRKYGTPWKLGECDSCNYRKIEITDSDMKNVTNNGLTAPRIIGYGSRTVYFYMGDLQGNLWRYSYDAKAFEGGVSPYDSEVKVKKVFKSSNENTLRPITSRPTVALSKDGGLIVAFGTGRYFGLNDLGSLKHTQQSLFSIHDTLGEKTFTLNDLAKREMKSDLTISKVSNEDKLGNGWYINFNNSLAEGERSIFSPRIRGNTLIFTTQLIGDFSKGYCGKSAGTISYADLYTGLGAYSKIDNKFVGEALVMPAMKMLGSFDSKQFSEQGGLLSDVAYVFAGGASDSNLINQNDEANRAGMNVPTKSVKGRLSWREIVKSGIQ
ncbi:MAG: Type pilus assembly protein tip-associated adhesin PilY1 [Pseudomonadota bacterium]|jgi:type IV pilus assembly protein PilY1